MPGLYREQVAVPGSGQEGSPLVVNAEGPAGSVILDEADDFSQAGSWTLASGTTWLASSATWGPAQVFVDGARLTAWAGALDSLPPRTFAVVPNAGVYVNLGGPNPGTRMTEIGRRHDGFYVSARSWVTLSGFTVRNAEDRGILLTNASSHLEVTDNLVTLSAHIGIQSDHCSAVHLARNTLSSDGSYGISIIGGSDSTVESNESSGNADPGGAGGDGLYVYGSVNDRILSNRFHDNAKAGENLERGANDNLSLQNVSWDNGGAGFNHLGASGVVHNGDVAFGNVGDGFALNDSSTAATLYNCISAVNGLIHSRFDLEVDSTSTAGLASDDNLLWNPSGTAPVRYASVSYLSVPQYSEASGLDTRTIQSDPRWFDPAGGDFRLLPGSPAIDCANSATPGWSASDAAGRPRMDDPATPNQGLGPVAYADRGAFEHDPSEWNLAVADTVPRMDHVIVVIMENKPYDLVRGAPYTASLIAGASSFANSYSYQHQSQSDYYALWSAVGRGVTESICPAVGSPYTTENLGHACESHGLSWRSYAEGLPAPGDTVCDSGLYTRRHCPWVDWSNLDSLNERPFTDLANDIEAGTLPRMAFVTPDLCDDTHNDCGADTILAGDTWLASNLPAMISAAGPRGLVILTWDEDDGSDGNHILTVFASPLAKAGFVSRRYINHFVVTRTICDALGLPPFAEAAAVPPITDAWLGQAAAGPRPGAPPSSAISLGLPGPNPFRNSVSATLRLPYAEPVDAAIFDLAGRRVKSLVQTTLSGLIRLQWNGTRDDGRGATAGIYVLRVRAGGETFEEKLALLESARR
jgi:acid phosphatase